MCGVVELRFLPKPNEIHRVNPAPRSDGFPRPVLHPSTAVYGNQAWGFPANMLTAHTESMLHAGQDRRGECGIFLMNVVISHAYSQS